jgi:hypothetical protein
MSGADEVTWEGEYLGVATAPKTITMTDRKLRPREKAVNYAPLHVPDDEPEVQAGPSTSAGPSKGKQRAKKRRICSGRFALAAEPPVGRPKGQSARF